MISRRSAGFTLIELLIAIAIVAILAAIAYPAYTENIRRGYRSEAAGILMESAQIIERYYTEKMTYNDGTTAAPLSFTQAPKTGTKRYTIQYASGSPTATAYTLEAVPVSTGDKCGTLTLTNLGVKGVSNTSGTPAEQCW